MLHLPTTLVTQEIREILMVNKCLIVEEFYKSRQMISFIWWQIRSVVFSRGILLL